MIRSYRCLLSCIYLFLIASNEAMDHPILGNTNLLKMAVENNLKLLSMGCGVQFLEYVVELEKMTPWAVKMFDATSKLQPGIISGNWYDMGDFDQCLNIKEQGFNKSLNAKYCTGTMEMLDNTDVFSVLLQLAAEENKKYSISAEKYKITLAMCVPEKCSASEIQLIASSLLEREITFTEDDCQNQNEIDITPQSVAVMGILFVLVLSIVLATVYDICWYKGKEPLPELWTSFSLAKNAKKLIETSRKPYHIVCLNGIKFFSMLWLNLGHSYLTTISVPLSNEVDLIKWTRTPFAMFIIGASLSLDTFFVIGGLLTVYTFLRKKEAGVKFNIALYYLHRIVRLTPGLSIMILLHAFVLPLLGSGPLWNNIDKYFGDVCRRKWWSTFIFVQNYANPTEICIPQTWYLSIDMQLFLLSPLILLPLSKWPGISIAAIIGLIFVGIIGPIIVGSELELRALYGSNEGALLSAVLRTEGLSSKSIKNYRPNADDYVKYYYYPTHTRMAPYLIGMLLGYAVYIVKTKNKKPRITKLWLTVCWAVSFATMLACIFGGQNILTGEYNRLQNSFHLGFVRPAWAVAVSWVIFACCGGYADGLNKFLSLAAFQFVSKIGYSVFLSHYAIQLMLDSYNRSPEYFTNILEIHKSLGDLCITIIFSVIFSFVFESPLIAVEKLYVGHDKIKSQAESNLSEVVEA